MTSTYVWGDCLDSIKTGTFLRTEKVKRFPWNRYALLNTCCEGYKYFNLQRIRISCVIVALIITEKCVHKSPRGIRGGLLKYLFLHSLLSSCYIRQVRCCETKFCMMHEVA